MKGKVIAKAFWKYFMISCNYNYCEKSLLVENTWSIGKASMALRRYRKA